MSWDVELIKPDGKVAEVPNQSEGSTIAIGGSNLASMSVTWNYSRFYYNQLDKEQGFRWLNGKKAKDTMERLALAVNILGTNQAPSYWDATKGNAGHILNVMLEWAKLHPEATWEIC